MLEFVDFEMADGSGKETSVATWLRDLSEKYHLHNLHEFQYEGERDQSAISSHCYRLIVRSSQTERNYNASNRSDSRPVEADRQ